MAGVASPFDALIIRLQLEVWEAAGTAGGPEQGKRAFVVQQLGLLREAYLALRTVGDSLWDARGTATVQGEFQAEVAALELPRNTRQIFLTYFSFVNVLCQMTRALPAHFPGAPEIPRHPRIRFYRNKVVEHWDAYVACLGQNGFFFKKGKAPIPAVEDAVLQSDRAALLADLKNGFKRLGATLAWDDKNTHSVVSASPEYNEAVFAALEAIPKTLAKQSGQDSDLDNVITTMLRFGFPTPILDVEEYSREVCEFLEKLL